MDDLELLKQIDALTMGNNYDEETFKNILPHFQAYLEAREKLRHLPLGDVKSAAVMLAGAQR